ncbi:hypothetical protein ACEWY4_016082 [Coilia grayii]|uniref:HAT C-terminal dimerisation domain-containing protein n=1 Tax=Coilia grayii TaxID=363190 RepID=A0ABD1JQP2_9TELE
MFDSHTGSNLAELLLEVFDEWDIKDKDPVLATDNAANMAIAAELAKLMHVRCFAHTLNIAAQRALKTTAVSRLLGRIRQIVSFFRKSTLASHILQEKQKLLNLPEHKLMTDVPTRWNSAFDMLEHFLEQQPAICATLLSSEVRKNAKELWSLSEADLCNAEDVAKTLRPLKVATLVMCEEQTPTVSIIAPLQAQLCQSTVEQTNDSGIIKDIKNALAQDLGKRYANNTFLQMASALDPRFKALPFMSEEERDDIFANVGGEAARISQVSIITARKTEDDHEPVAVEGQLEDGPTQPPPCKKSCALSDLFGETFLVPKRQDSHSTPIDQAMSEIRAYRESEPLTLSDDPLSWWRKHEGAYPLLSHLARNTLCVPGTSVAAERIFSTAGDIVTAERNVLRPDHVDQLLFLNKNLP